MRRGVDGEVPVDRRVDGAEAADAVVDVVLIVAEQHRQALERSLRRPDRGAGGEQLGGPGAQLGGQPAVVAQRVVAPVLEQGVGEHAVVEDRETERRVEHAIAPGRRDEHVVGDLVVVEHHVARDVGERPLHLGQTGDEVDVDLVALAQVALAILLGLGRVLGLLVRRPLVRLGQRVGRRVQVLGHQLGELGSREVDPALRGQLRGERQRLPGVLGVRGVDVGDERRHADLVAPAGVAPRQQVERGELTERDDVVGPVLAGELPRTLGDIEATSGRKGVGPDGQVPVGDRDAGILHVGVVRLGGIDRVGVVGGNGALHDVGDEGVLDRGAEDRVVRVGGADQLDGEVDQPDHHHRVDVVGVDLIAAEDQLVRARARILHVVGDVVVDVGEGVGVAAARQPARAVEDAQIGQLRGARGEAREHVGLVAEGEVGVPVGRLLGRHVAQHVQRRQIVGPAAGDDRHVVGVEGVGLQALARGLGDAHADEAEVQLVPEPPRVLGGARQERCGVRCGGNALVHDEGDLRRLAQGKPDADQVGVHPPEDRPSEQEGECHERSPRPSWSGRRRD